MSDTLQRELGLGPATAMVVSGMIAVGIFLVPAGMAKSLGSPLLLLVIWLLMASMALSGALCYGELASRFPQAGGGYVYLRETYGPQIAFLYGWKSMLVLDPGITAALGMGMAAYADSLFDLGDLGMKITAITVILSLAVVNMVGVRFGAWLVQWVTVFKIGVLAFIALWGFGFGLGDWSNFSPFVTQRPGSAPLFPDALAGGLVGAFFAFAGWWDVSKLAGEVRDPARTLPRALILAVVVVTLTYIVTSAAFMYLVPMQEITSDRTFAAQVGRILFGRSGEVIFSAIVIISVLGSITGMLMAMPRVYFAMARDGVFLSFAGKIHPSFGTPARAIAIQAGLAALYVMLGSFETVVAYIIFIAVVFIALTVIGVPVLRKRYGDTPAYKTPLYPATPIVFLILVTVLLLLLGGSNPLQAGLGVAVVLAGIPFYHLVFKQK
ncbi:MAG: amino acid permease [Candidatus Latescibacteria bacterium]|jgi:basic amino acid/polyamine antiporter, APA family|nr:amino acid permease [Candidatus Latescibacterota bacterium]